MSLRVLAALFLILAASVALRVWGLDYGVPQTTARPDEERIVERARHMFATGTLHPGHYAYPSLAKYLGLLALGTFYGLGKLLGEYSTPFDFLFDTAVVRPGLHYLICRVVSVACGVATVAATYVLARETCGKRKVALFAATALAVCHLHVRDSHFATVDVAATLFVTLSLVFAVKAAREPAYRFFVLAGVFAGLAASTKYNAGLVGIGILPAVWTAYRDPSKAVTLSGALRRVAIAGAMGALAFGVTSPYVLLEYRAALADMKLVSGTLYRPEGDSALWTHLGVTLPLGLGWALYGVSLAGLARAAWLRRAGDRVLLTFFISFFVLISSVNVVYPRYCLPLLPVMVVLAADALRALLSRAPQIITLPAVGLVLAPSLYGSVEFDRVASRRDTRLQAMDWVATHVSPQSEILLCRGYGAPEVNEDRRRPPAFRPTLIDCSLDKVRGSSARYLITNRHPCLTAFSRVPTDLEDWLEANAESLVELDPFRYPMGREPYFYHSDAFYIPYSGLAAMDRGGPIVRIWALPDS